MSRLQLIDICKEYPGVKANDHVSLRVQPGEIHAVLGENGAGKSTLMKVIYGSVQPDSGEMRWNDRRVTLQSPEAARALGISMVFQHFSLFETLTVAQNVWLGLGADWTLPKVAARVAQLAAEYGLDLEPERPVHSLSVGEKQRVEIARALMTQPQLLILDEPTSVLTPRAIRSLFDVLRKLAASGCSILYISHKLDEIRELCQRCTVLRAGRVTGEVEPSGHTNASLSRLMIGAEPHALPARQTASGEPVLQVSRLRVPRASAFAVALTDIDLTVRSAQIVGIAGVSGNGQSELLAALSGELALSDEHADVSSQRSGGVVQLFGADISSASVSERRARGLRFIPEERLGRATVPHMSLTDNALLTRSESVGALGFLDRTRLFDLVRRVIGRFAVKAGGPSAPAKSLSGGNLQKYIVGREIDAEPKLLIVSQPTWGVDVGAAARIRGELLALRDRGVAILVVSEDLEELFELSDVLVVMAAGKLSPAVARAEASVEQIGAWMSGLFGPNAAEVGVA